MGNPQKKQQIRTFLIPFIFTVLLAGFSFFTTFSWEGNDDQAIARILASPGDGYAVFVWRLLSLVVHWFYMTFPVISWWAVFSCGAIFISAGFISYVICKRYELWLSVFITLLTFLFLWYVGLYKLNFTRTAAIVAIAGCMLMADSIFPTIHSRSSKAQYIIGILWLLLGASFRKNCALLSLAFLAAGGCIALVQDSFSFQWSWFKKHLKPIALLGIAALSLFFAITIHNGILTPEQKAFQEYNAARSALQDYSAMYDDYDQQQELYQSLHLTPEAVSLLFGWGSEDTEIFSLETMQTIAATKRSGNLLDVVTVLKANIAIILLTLLCSLALIIHRKRNPLLYLLLPVTTLVIFLYLVYEGRIKPRVTVPVIFMMACMLLFLLGKDAAPTQQPQQTTRQRKGFICVVSALLILSGIAISLAQPLVRKNIQNGWPQADQTEKDLCDQVAQDSQHIYIFDLLSQPFNDYSAYAFWNDIPTNNANNRFVLGGWNSRMPYRVEGLQKFGIDNPMRALYENPKVYSTYSQRVLQHIRYYYDRSITVSGIGKLGERFLVQYAAYQDHTQPFSTGTAFLEQLSYSDNGNTPKLYVSFQLSETEPEKIADREIYLNVCINDCWRSYRLKWENNSAWAYLFDTQKDLDQISDAAIVETNADGTTSVYTIQNPEALLTAH